MNHLFAGLEDAVQGTQERHAANPENRPTVHIDIKKPTYRQAAVTSVTLHGTRPRGRADAVIHWRLFCQLDVDHEASIELNSQKLGFNNLDTKLFIVQRRYNSSTNSEVLGQEVFRACRGVTFTVADLIDLLLENRRDRYRLTAEGKGCTYWCLVVLQDLINKKWLDVAVAEKAHRCITACAEVSKGTFI
ncbi:hypothetical protein BV22DRAFT_1190602 [Leucogyrophana mollusca]|uniref:Uncharacterized protein n=1 Tax=Leucogyrophana mollusca TaxID=85980 RepID=A0ACB8BZX6_9AGAM|nr:hypothetical protein BV22DRAFT_1190602 [Leucogyrophana mollusca]